MMDMSTMGSGMMLAMGIITSRFLSSQCLGSRRRFKYLRA